MRADVDRILSDRSRRAGRGPEAASLAAALGLHVLVILVALVLPRLQPPPKPLEFVPVTVIPAQALGVRRPAPPRRSSPKPAEPAAENPPEEAAPEPAAPAPKAPEPKPEPPRPKPADEAPILPSPKAPKPEPPKPAADPGKATGQTTGKTTGKTPSTPPAPSSGKPAAKPGPESGGRGQGNPNSPPNATAVGETGDQAGRRGAPTGSPLGTTAFGSQIAGIDNPDFTYGYYLDRLLSLIDANWVRPSMGSGVRAIVSFRIRRDGSLDDLRVSESSGYNSFDLAALRAVQNAAPFPPLPRPYKQDDLGVNLIVY